MAFIKRYGQFKKLVRLPGTILGKDCFIFKKMDNFSGFVLEYIFCCMTKMSRNATQTLKKL